MDPINPKTTWHHKPTSTTSSPLTTGRFFFFFFAQGTESPSNKNDVDQIIILLPYQYLFVFLNSFLFSSLCTTSRRLTLPRWPSRQRYPCPKTFNLLLVYRERTPNFVLIFLFCIFILC